jgi:hypothetical protein
MDEWLTEWLAGWLTNSENFAKFSPCHQANADMVQKIH